MNKCKYVCIVVKNGKVVNTHIGNEVDVFNHLEYTAKQYIDEAGVSQIGLFKQYENGKIETMYEWVPSVKLLKQKAMF